MSPRTICLLPLLSSLVLSSCGTDVKPRTRVRRDPNAPTAASLDSAPAAIVAAWNAAALDAIRSHKISPPLAANLLALTHVAMYDAGVAARADDGGTTYFDVERSPKVISPVAAQAAAWRVLSSLFPDDLRKFTDLFWANVPKELPESLVRDSVAFGQAIADAAIERRAGDRAITGGTETPKGNASPGVWVPTPPTGASFAFPRWGDADPWTFASTAYFRAAPPAAVTSAAYARDLTEVAELGVKGSSKRTADETQIASFWADEAGTETSPGHWNSIAAGELARCEVSFQEASRLFAVLNTALADAGIATWEAKRRYAVWRPVTAVVQAGEDGNDATSAVADWTPLLPTPPTPSYPSGHSAFAAAAATVLERFFGAGYGPVTVVSDGIPGTSRSYKSFDAAAREAGRSRILGGVGFSIDNDAGLSMGLDIGLGAVRSILTHPLDGGITGCKGETPKAPSGSYY